MIVSGRDFPTNRGGLCKKGWTSAELLALAGAHHRAAGPRGRRRLPRRELGRRARPHRRPAARHPRRARRRCRRRLRRRRPHEREGLPARQVRPPRPRHAPHRLQRPVLHVVGGGRGQPRVRHRPRPAVPARGPRRRAHDPAARHQRRRDDAAVHRPPRAARRPRGGLIVVDPRRTATARLTDDGAGIHVQPTPGTDLVLLLGLTHVVIAERTRRPRRTSPSAPAASTGCAAASPAGGPSACRSVTGVPACAAAASSPGASPRAAAPTSSPGAASSSTSTAPTPRPRPSTSPSCSGCRVRRTPATARSPGRATARAAASTARRPTSSPATARSPTRPRARTSPRSGASTPDIAPGPGHPRRGTAAVARAAGRGARPARARLERRRLRPERRVVRARARGARPARRVRLLPLRDRGARRRRAARHAVGRGGGHDDLARGPRPPAPRRSTRRPACATSCGSCRARPAARRAGDVQHRPARGVRRTRRASRGRPRRLLGPRATRCSTPASRRTGPTRSGSHGHAAALRSTASPTPTAARASSPCAPRADDAPPRSATACSPSSPAGCSSTTSRARRPAGCPSCWRRSRTPRRSCTRRPPQPLGIADGDPVELSNDARRRALPGEAHAPTSGTTPSSCRSISPATRARTSSPMHATDPSRACRSSSAPSCSVRAGRRRSSASMPERVVLVGYGPVGARFAEELLPAVRSGRVALTVVGAEARPTPTTACWSPNTPSAQPSATRSTMTDRRRRSTARACASSPARRRDDQPQRSTVRSAPGSSVPYDRLVLATGARANVPTLDGVPRLRRDRMRPPEDARDPRHADARLPARRHRCCAISTTRERCSTRCRPDAASSCSAPACSAWSSRSPPPARAPRSRVVHHGESPDGAQPRRGGGADARPRGPTQPASPWSRTPARRASCCHVDERRRAPLRRAHLRRRQADRRRPARALVRRRCARRARRDRRARTSRAGCSSTSTCAAGPTPTSTRSATAPTSRRAIGATARRPTGGPTGLIGPGWRQADWLAAPLHRRLAAGHPIDAPGFADRGARSSCSRRTASTSSRPATVSATSGTSISTRARSRVQLRERGGPGRAVGRPGARALREDGVARRHPRGVRRRRDAAHRRRAHPAVRARQRAARRPLGAAALRRPGLRAVRRARRLRARRDGVLVQRRHRRRDRGCRRGGRHDGRLHRRDTRAGTGCGGCKGRIADVLDYFAGLEAET